MENENVARDTQQKVSEIVPHKFDVASSKGNVKIVYHKEVYPTYDEVVKKPQATSDKEIDQLINKEVVEASKRALWLHWIVDWMQEEAN